MYICYKDKQKFVDIIPDDIYGSRYAFFEQHFRKQLEYFRKHSYVLKLKSTINNYTVSNYR